MAIILDRYVDIETHAYDLRDALIEQGETRFCFDCGIMNSYFRKHYFPFSLVPLDAEFRCKRTLVYGDGKKVPINSNFGMFKDDFINVDVPHIEVLESDYKDFGVIISNHNGYFDIVNAMAKHLNIVDSTNEKSFIMTNGEIMNFALVPFTLTTDGYKFTVKNIEDELPTSEYDAFIESFTLGNMSL